MESARSCSHWYSNGVDSTVDVTLQMPLHFTNPISYITFNLLIFIRLAHNAFGFILPRRAVVGAVADPVARHAGPVPARHLAAVARAPRCQAVGRPVLVAVERCQQLPRHQAVTVV